MSNPLANLLKQAQPAIQAGNNFLQDVGLIKPQAVNLNDIQRVAQLKTRYATKELPKLTDKAVKKVNKFYDDLAQKPEYANRADEIERVKKGIGEQIQAKAIEKQQTALTGITKDKINQFAVKKAQIDVKKQVGQPLTAQEQTIDTLSNPLQQFSAGLSGGINRFGKDVQAVTGAIGAKASQLTENLPGIKQAREAQLNQVNKRLSNPNISADERINLLKQKSFIEADSKTINQLNQSEYKKPTFIENVQNKTLGKELAEGYRKTGAYKTGSFVGEEILPVIAMPETGIGEQAAKLVAKTGIGKAIAKYGGKETVNVLTKGAVENAIQEQPIGLIQEGARVAGGEQTVGQALQNQVKRTALAGGLGGVAELGIDKIGKGFNQLGRAKKFEEVKAQREAVQGERQARDADMEQLQNALQMQEQRQAVEALTPKTPIEKKVAKLDVKRENELKKVINQAEDRVYKQNQKEALLKLKEDLKAKQLPSSEVVGRTPENLPSVEARPQVSKLAPELRGQNPLLGESPLPPSTLREATPEFSPQVSPDPVLGRRMDKVETLQQLKQAKSSELPSETNVLQDSTLAQKVPESTQFTNPKNQTDLEETYKKTFGLDESKAKAASIVTDKIFDTIAQRKGITKEAAYSDVFFKKSSLNEVGRNAKFQTAQKEFKDIDVSALKTLKGKEIGRGERSIVYEIKGHPDKVLKVSKDPSERKSLKFVHDNPQEFYAKVFDLKKEGNTMYAVLEKVDGQTVSFKHNDGSGKYFYESKFRKFSGKDKSQREWIKQQLEDPSELDQYWDFLDNAEKAGFDYWDAAWNTGRRSDGSFVMFDGEVSPELLKKIKFQSEKGAMETLESGQKVIHALTDPNVSTPLHEIAHVYEEVLSKSERNTILDWAGSKEWDTNASEKFARGFERYLSEGKAPIPELKQIFEDFKGWLTDIYKGITGSEIDLKLNKKMREIYDSMLGETDKLKQAPKSDLIQKTNNLAGEIKQRGLIETIDKNPNIPQALKGKLKNSPEANYQVRNTKDLFERATERVLTQDTESLAKEIRMKSRNEGNWTDEEVATGYELARKYESEGKLDEAAEIEEALAKKATEGGQMIQAYAKYGKMTPEGAIREANKILEKAMPKAKAQKLKEATANVIKDFNKANKKAVEDILNFCPPGSFE